MVSTAMMNRPFVFCAAGLFVACICARAEPDEDALGKAMGYPRGTAAAMYAERFKVGSFSATDKILPTRFIEHGDKVTPLPAGEPVEIHYRFKNERFTLNDYLDHQRVTGLLILKEDKIAAEHYRYDRRAQDRFLSFSMSKSITSLLAGIALQKGLIASLDDRAEKYVPELRGSGYGEATIRQLLHMSSGMKFVEEYNGHDDCAKLANAELGRSAEKPLQVLASFQERLFPAGEKMGYASSESAVVGYVVARAAGKNLATLASEWLWKPLGAEAEAAWNLSVDGQERAAGSFNACLRDYGRLGLLLACDGEIGGKQIVPKDYLLEATDATLQPTAFRPRKASPYYGYGYLFWIFPMRERTFALLGIYGQAIFVQPSSGIVMVQTAATHEARDRAAGAERDALWRGVLESLGGHTEP